MPLFLFFYLFSLSFPSPCPTTLSGDLYNNTCYYTSPNEDNFEESFYLSRIWCKEHFHSASDLVVLDNLVHFEYILDLIEYNGGDTDKWWIGLTDIISETEYEWVNKESYDGSLDSVFIVGSNSVDIDCVNVEKEGSAHELKPSNCRNSRKFVCALNMSEYELSYSLNPWVNVIYILDDDSGEVSTFCDFDNMPCPEHTEYCGNYHYKNKEEVCSGRGTCLSDYDNKINYCDCDFDHYIGDECEDQDWLLHSQYMFFEYIYIIIPVVVVLGIVFVVLLACCAKKSCKKQSKRKEEMEKVDILLKEQELEDRRHRAAFANLQINKGLFNINYDRICLMGDIGSGGSGAVIYKCKYNGILRAFKVFKTKSLSNQRKFDEFEKEVSIISGLNHPNILRFYGCALKPPRVGYLTELCENGTLRNYIQHIELDPDLTFAYDKKVKMVHQIASAMQYLHAKSIVHRDLKSENVLLNADVEAKLMDFGVSKVLEKDDGNKVNTRQVGTTWYMAPEVTLGCLYDEKCDVYSFSILIYEILTENVFPYGRNVMGNIEVKVATDPTFRPQIPNHVIVDPKCTWWVNLIIDCWQAFAIQRPTFDSIVNLVEPYATGKPRKLNITEPSKSDRDHSNASDKSANSFETSSFESPTSQTPAGTRKFQLNIFDKEKENLQKKAVLQSVKKPRILDMMKKPSGDVVDFGWKGNKAANLFSNPTGNAICLTPRKEEVENLRRAYNRGEEVDETDPHIQNLKKFILEGDENERTAGMAYEATPPRETQQNVNNRKYSREDLDNMGQEAEGNISDDGGSDEEDEEQRKARIAQQRNDNLLASIDRSRIVMEVSENNSTDDFKPKFSLEGIERLGNKKHIDMDSPVLSPLSEVRHVFKSGKKEIIIDRTKTPHSINKEDLHDDKDKDIIDERETLPMSIHPHRTKKVIVMTPAEPDESKENVFANKIDMGDDKPDIPRNDISMNSPDDTNKEGKQYEEDKKRNEIDMSFEKEDDKKITMDVIEDIKQTRNVISMSFENEKDIITPPSSPAVEETPAVEERQKEKLEVKKEEPPPPVKTREQPPPVVTGREPIIEKLPEEMNIPKLDETKIEVKKDDFLIKTPKSLKKFIDMGGDDYACTSPTTDVPKVGLKFPVFKKKSSPAPPTNSRKAPPPVVNSRPKTPPRRGGTQPVTPPRRGGTQPATPPRRGGTQPATPPRRGGTQPATPPRRGGTQQPLVPKRSPGVPRRR